MGGRSRYGPRGAARTRRAVRRARCSTWWWADGIRFTEHDDVLYGWRLGFFGMPVTCGQWFAGPLYCTGAAQFLEDCALTLLRKGDKQVSDRAGMTLSEEDKLGSAYPTLFSFLTQTRWEDDSPRQTGSLLVFVQDGILKVMLRDRNDGTCLWVAGRGLSQVLAAAEGSLVDPGADWRQDRQVPGDLASRTQKGSGRR